MHQIKRSAISNKSRLSDFFKTQNELSSFVNSNPAKCLSDMGLADFSSKLSNKSAFDTAKRVVWKLGYARQPIADMLGANGIPVLIRGQSVSARDCLSSFKLPFQLTGNCRTNIKSPCFARSFASTASERRGEKRSETKKDISTVEDPFDAPTYNIPEKPVTFAEGASYSLIILAGLGVAAAAGYAVFKELIFEPKEYKIFGKALKRVQDDSQVKVRIGSPITGYGQESRNRAARQRIPNRIWTDEFGVEHVEINFYIRGPHGNGKVYTEMYKDKADKQWKYTHLIVEIISPSPTRLMLESYLPA